VHAYHVRQLVSLGNAQLNQRIQQEWGEIRETDKDKQTQINRWRRQMTPAQLRRADASNGRRLFATTCANCHVLFGEGTRVGPDITGSNRANLDYLLENILDPSAVLGKDYRMTVLVCGDGRVVSGLVQKETDSALTLRTINDTVVVAKSEIEERKTSELSLMPERLLDSMSTNEVRDLIAYLGSPTQVAMRRRPAEIDPMTGRVPDSLEGESLRVLATSVGRARPQSLDIFPKYAWSGTHHLWWTGAQPGARLELELPVKTDGRYVLDMVLTRAPDYGIVQLLLDDTKLGQPIDLYNEVEVRTSKLFEFEGIDLKAGAHRLAVEIVGTNPKAVPSYMFGLDFVRLQPQ
jgi:putative heme-binding domain-containing protein